MSGSRGECPPMASSKISLRLAVQIPLIRFLNSVGLPAPSDQSRIDRSTP